MPPLWASATPIAVLLLALVGLIVWHGTDAINSFSPYALLGASVLALILTALTVGLRKSNLSNGLRRSARQIMPAVPLLALIALVSTTWMLGGIVPTLIDYGLKLLNPTLFLMLTCMLCACVSVLTGSSWTTIATVGVAFMGIGAVLGYSTGWIAGAIISGAYFGDKVSPLSDTTIIASSTCGVDLFSHIRYMMLSSAPAMLLALAVYTAVGVFVGPEAETSPDPTLIEALHRTFNITPWVLAVPAVTGILIACKVRTIIVLAVSSVLGVICMYATQPQIASQVHPVLFLLDETVLSTGHSTLDNLVATGGLAGMLPTILLVLCAMLFGAAMLGTGMLRRIAEAFTHRLTKRTHIVGATVGTGLFLNACTADQYLSIIIGGNMYGNVYSRFGLQPRLLSRTLEDSISVTSVLIPWNSCGVTQSTVLGVATLVYFPYCIFNIASPLMSLLLAWTGFRIPVSRPESAGATA